MNVRLLGAAGAAGLALVAGCGGDDEPAATYRGRAVHVHVKVLPGGNTAVTSQLFFDEGFTDSLYELEPYSSTGERDVRIDDDMVYSEADAEGTPLMLTLKRDGDEVLAAGNIVIAA